VVGLIATAHSLAQKEDWALLDALVKLPHPHGANLVWRREAPIFDQEDLVAVRI
jgi:hypothetical protein